MTVTFGHAEGDGRAPFVPSEEWIEAFEAQATEDLYLRIKRYARARARLVAHAGRPIDEQYTNDLVQDAIGDTFDGVLAWDPERVTPSATSSARSTRGRATITSTRSGFAR